MIGLTTGQSVLVFYVLPMLIVLLGTMFMFRVDGIKPEDYDDGELGVLFTVSLLWPVGVLLILVYLLFTIFQLLAKEL